MFSTINNPYSNEYLTNFQEYNQLNEGNLSINLEKGNFSQDENNLDERLQTSANFYNYGNGQIQLQGSAIVNAETPTSQFLIGELPSKFKPKLPVKYTVPYDRAGTLGTNFISILKAGSSISGVNVTNAGSYTSIPTVLVSGDGEGASISALLGAITASVASPGSLYAVGDNITLTGGTASIQPVLSVSTVRLISAGYNVQGSGYVVNDILTLVGGIFTSAATVKVVSVDGSGAITGVSVNTPGSYTSAISGTTYTSTGGSGTGATFNVVFGVDTVSVVNSGKYSVLPSNPVSQGSTTGSGSGATFNITAYRLTGGLINNGGEGYTFANIELSSPDGKMTAVLSSPSPAQIILENAPNLGDIVYLDGPPLLVDKFY